PRIAQDTSVAERARSEFAGALEPAEHLAVRQQFRRFTANALPRPVERRAGNQQRIAGAARDIIRVLDAERRPLHHKGARLLLDRQTAVIGATDRDSVVAGSGLNPDIVKPRLAHDAPVGDTIERYAAGKAQVPGARGFTQPASTREQHLLGVVLNAPSQILPMPHGRTGFPLLLAIRHPRLIEFRIPFGNMQLAVLEREQPS